MTDVSNEQAPVVPATRLSWPLAFALVLFLPLGLVGAYFGWRTAGAIEAGDLVAAQRSSRRAQRWIIAAIVVGLVIGVLLFALLLLLGAFPTG